MRAPVQSSAREESRFLRRAVVRVLVSASAGSMLCGCSNATRFWNVPVESPMRAAQYEGYDPRGGHASQVPYEVRPETICGLVRDGAYAHTATDPTSGVLLTILGVFMTATGSAVAATAPTFAPRPADEAPWIGVGSAGAALGVLAGAAGIYFIVKAGQERQEYWAMNAAVAKIRADYAANPVGMPPNARLAFETWRRKPSSENYQYFQYILTQERAWQTTLEGHAFAMEAAKRTKIRADEAAAQSVGAAQFATFRVNDVTDARATYQTHLTAYEAAVADEAKALAALAGKDAGKVQAEVDSRSSLAAAEARMTLARDELERARTAQDAAEKVAMEAAVHAASLGDDAADAANLLKGQQAAWADCSAALGSLTGYDATANGALVNALGPGAAKSTAVTATAVTTGH